MVIGTYRLDPWRRIFANMKDKKKPDPNSKRALLGSIESQIKRKQKENEDQKKKLSSIVNKILASKNPSEDLPRGGIMMAGDDFERTEASDNYNIYG